MLFVSVQSLRSFSSFIGFSVFLLSTYFLAVSSDRNNSRCSCYRSISVSILHTTTSLVTVHALRLPASSTSITTTTFHMTTANGGTVLCSIPTPLRPTRLFVL